MRETYSRDVRLWDYLRYALYHWAEQGWSLSRSAVVWTSNASHNLSEGPTPYRV